MVLTANECVSVRMVVSVAMWMGLAPVVLAGQEVIVREVILFLFVLTKK